MSGDPCPVCGGPTATADEVIQGHAEYADTRGGHADRHTTVVEAAERVIAQVADR